MKNLLFISLILVVAQFTGVTFSIGEEKKHSWPVILPMKKSLHFADNHDMGAQLKITGIDGAPLYLLECYLNAYDHEDRNFDYSGDFECRLTSLYSKDRYSTLLTEEKHQTRDWQSRGRFLNEELTGKCLEYPEYGRVRHFRLRDINLTFEVKHFKMKPGSSSENIPWNRERIMELDLEVTVATDTTATSEIAEPSKYIAPPRLHPEDATDLSRKCDKILSK